MRGRGVQWLLWVVAVGCSAPSRHGSRPSASPSAATTNASTGSAPSSAASPTASATALASSGGPLRVARVAPLARVVEVLTAAGDVRHALPLDGAIWLATAGGVLRASGELVEEARFTTLDGLPSNDVWALAARGGQLFAATSAGVVRARLDGGRLVEVRRFGEADGLPAKQARALAVVDDVLYAGTWGGGVARLDGERWTPLGLGPAANNVTRLVADGHRLWITTAGGGVARLDGERARWFTTRDGLPDDLVWDLVADERGVTVATIAGSARIEVERGERVTALPDRVERRALSRSAAVTAAHPRAHAIVEAGERFLVCGEDGVQLVTRDGRGLAQLAPLGLPSPDVTALAVGQDALYVGTFDRGVVRVRFDRDDGSVEVEPIAGLIDARINALAVRLDGSGALCPEDRPTCNEELWVGTPRGASRVRDGQVTQFTSADGLPDDHVNAILAEPDAVRLATTRGFAELADGAVARITPEHGLPATRLMALGRGSDGALWIGSAHGAASLPCGQGRCESRWTTARALRGELPDDFVTAIATVGDDVWIGTYASGLARRSEGRWTLYREPELASNWVNAGALVGWSQRLWVGTVERGLMVSPRLRAGDDEGRWSTLTVADGLPGDDVTALAVDDDALWVGTRGGLARLAAPALGGAR